MLLAFVKELDIDVKFLLKNLEEHQRKAILHGSVDEATFFGKTQTYKKMGRVL